MIFQPNIIPVCVPETDENFVGTNAHVTGWGRLYEGKLLLSFDVCINRTKNLLSFRWSVAERVTRSDSSSH